MNKKDIPTGKQLSALINKQKKDIKVNLAEKEKQKMRNKEDKEENLYLSLVENIDKVLEELPAFIEENLYLNNNFEFEFDIKLLNNDQAYEIPNRGERFKIRFNEEKKLKDIVLEYSGGSVWYLIWG